MEISTRKHISLILLLGLSIFYQPLQSQSIYSFQGVGILEAQNSPSSINMAEAGVAVPTVWGINALNPAMLVYNSFSSFQMGLHYSNRQISSDSVSGNTSNGGIRFIGYAFPIIRGKWGSSFGLTPFSTVDYNTYSIQEDDTREDSNLIINTTGEGGLSSLYWSNGFFIKKRVAVGIKFNYIFGSIEQQERIFIDDPDFQSLSNFDYIIKRHYSKLNILLGAAYRWDVSKKSALNFGITYSPHFDFKANQTISSQRTSLTTHEISEKDFKLAYPSALRVGLSYQLINIFTVGLDLEFKPKKGEIFQASNKIALGFSWIPDYDNIKSYLKRISYKGGFVYEKLPYVVNGEKINDYGIHFGTTLPVNLFSRIDLGIKLGTLGTVANGAVKENYFKVIFGATINDNWFIKRKYD